jgi:hypothetical protein
MLQCNSKGSSRGTGCAAASLLCMPRRLQHAPPGRPWKPVGSSRPAQKTAARAGGHLKVLWDVVGSMQIGRESHYQL